MHVSKGKLPVSLKNAEKHIRFGLNVALYREHMGMAQGQLAKRRESANRTCEKIETVNTPTNVAVKIVFRLADVLNVLLPAYWNSKMRSNLIQFSFDFFQIWGILKSAKNDTKSVGGNVKWTLQSACTVPVPNEYLPVYAAGLPTISAWM